MYQKFETYISRNETALFYIHVSWSDLYNLTMGLICNLYFTVLHERTLLNCRSGKKGRELAPSTGWRQFPVLSSAPAVEPRVHLIRVVT
jgi:hypothetical protein